MNFKSKILCSNETNHQSINFTLILLCLSALQFSMHSTKKELKIKKKRLCVSYVGNKNRKKRNKNTTKAKFKAQKQSRLSFSVFLIIIQFLFIYFSFFIKSCSIYYRRKCNNDCAAQKYDFYYTHSIYCKLPFQETKLHISCD